MTIKKTDAQAVALVMFGVYAGGFLGSLTSEGSKNGLGGLASALAPLQPNIVGRDLVQDGDWADYTLGNFGLNQADALYVPAKVAVLVQLGLGRTRGDVVADLVTYVGAVASGDVTAPAVEGLADRFFDYVVRGVRWSEDVSPSGGARSTDLLQMRAAAVDDGYKPGGSGTSAPPPPSPTPPAPSPPSAPPQSVSVSPLLEFVGPYFDAVLALRSFDAQGISALSSAIEAAELKADAAIKDSLLDGSFQYNVDESATGQTSTANQAELAAQQVAQVRWQTTLDSYQQFKQSSLTTLASVASGAATLVDQYATQVTKFQKAASVFSDAEAALAFEVARPSSNFTGGFVLYELNSTTQVVTLSFWKDGTTEVLGSASASGNWTDGPSTKLVSAGAQELASAYVAASVEYSLADTSLVASLAAIEAKNASLTDALTVDEVNSLTSLDGPALDYLSVVLALNDFKFYVDSATAALANVAEVTSSEGAARASLVSDVEAALAKLTAKGYILQKLQSGGRVSADSQGNLYDVFGLSGGPNNAEVLQFGSAGSDALIMPGYRLASGDTGLDSILEFKLMQTGLDTVVVLESVPNGFSSTALGAEAEFSVVLVGKSSTSLSLADGLILG